MTEIIDDLSPLVGLKISKVEVVSICHILRLYFEDKFSVDLPASWRIRSDKKTILGASNIDFYMEMDDAVLDEDDLFYSKKASTLEGKKLIDLSMDGGDLFFELSGKRYIDIFNLSSEELTIIMRKC
ncbi:hypothetical protein [Marinobacter sediminicola]|uniref:hypothetical protein n=1 Tax=Marinobacter sediminicola TaxID=3072994 RepID=UPI002812839E|nr:hypothetical protein [Marinobacter sp. F26243]